MKKTQLLVAACASLIVLGASSCSSTKRYSSSTDSNTTSSDSMSNGGGSSSASMDNKGSNSGAQMASMKSDGSNMVASMALPTGNKSTSALLLEKSAPKNLMAGKDFEYLIKVSNLTNMALENVVVTEDMAGGLTFKGSEPKATSKAGGNVVFNLGTVPAKGSKSVRVMGAAAKTGTVSACSQVTYNTGVCLAMNVIEPALTLACDGTKAATPCDPIKYNFVVANPGSGTAENVMVTANLPEGLMTADGKTAITRNVGDIMAGKSKEFSVNAKASRTGNFGVRADAKASGGLTAVCSGVSTVVTQPALRIGMGGPEKQFSGRNCTYNMNVTNTGNATAVNTTVQAMVPSGARFRSATDGGNFAGGKVTWNLGDLAPNASKKISMKLVGEGGQIKVDSVSQAECADPVRGSATTMITGIPAILLEVIDLEDPIEVGADLTYVIKVTNQGTAPGTGIRVVAEIPGNTSLVSAGGATGETVSGRKITFAPLASLAPKQEAEWRIVVKGDTPADARFKVNMRSDQMRSEPVIETEATNYYE